MATMRITRLEARWLTGDTWSPAASLLGHEAALVDAYLGEESLTCCSFQAGFFIDVDGAPWSDEGTVDELAMTMSWFRAMKALLEGATHYGPTIGPWEESQLTWQRDGDTLIMEDSTTRMVSGECHTFVSMRRVELPFRGFVARFAEASRPLAALCRAIQTQARTRASRTRDPLLSARLTIIRDNVLDEGEHGLGLIETVIDLPQH